MPTPSDPHPVPLHGGTNAGVGPLRVCAFGDAPAASSTSTAASWFSRTAIISAVCPNSGSRASTLRAALEEQAQRGRCAGPRRGHQRGLAARIDRIRIDARIEQAPDHVGVAVDRGEIERRHAVAIAGRRLRAGAQQRVRDVQAIGVNRRVQRRHAVHARRVDVASLLEQRANGGVVAPLRRIDERSSPSAPKVEAGSRASDEPHGAL